MLMRKVFVVTLVILVVVVFTPTFLLTHADEIYEEIHDINLYIFGKGGSSPTNPTNPSGNLITKAPDSTTDEYQIFYPKRSPPYDEYWWFSDPLYLNISIVKDVHFTIWAVCSSPRFISFILYLGIQKPDGIIEGSGRGTGSKLVYNEPVEFNAVLPKEGLGDELKTFHAGDRIGIGILAEYYNTQPQPPAEVRVLYNSTSHPSHMTINTSSVSIDILNPKISSEKASVDVIINDAFGIYDITDYDIQITSPSGKNIVNLEITEDQTLEDGKVILVVMWDKSEDRSGNHTITVTVMDNNENRWDKVEMLELNFLYDGNGLEFSLNLFILLVVGIFIVIAFYFFISRKRK